MFQSTDQFMRWLRLSLIFPLCVLNGWLLIFLINNIQPLFNILLTATLLAFLLDYPIRFLKERGIKRGIAIGIVLLIATLILLGISLTLVPVLIQQLSQLVNQLPGWATTLEDFLQSLEDWPPLQRAGFDLGQQAENAVQQVQDTLRSAASTTLGLLSGVIQNILNLFVTLVLTVFLLIGGETAWQGMLRWLPPWWRQRIGTHAPHKLKTFIGGQVAIAGGFGATLALIYTILGIPLGLLFGFTIGLGSLIPFLGAITQVSVSLFLVIQDVWTGVKVFGVAFVVGQVVDQVVSPRVLGSIIGLNPVWVLISVFMGIRLGGILGALLAVPVASTIKVIADEIIDSMQDPEEILLAQEKADGEDPPSDRVAPGESDGE